MGGVRESGGGKMEKTVLNNKNKSIFKEKKKKQNNDPFQLHLHDYAVCTRELIHCFLNIQSFHTSQLLTSVPRHSSMCLHYIPVFCIFKYYLALLLSHCYHYFLKVLNNFLKSRCIFVLPQTENSCPTSNSFLLWDTAEAMAQGGRNCSGL